MVPSFEVIVRTILKQCSTWPLPRVPVSCSRTVRVSQSLPTPSVCYLTQDPGEQTLRPRATRHSTLVLRESQLPPPCLCSLPSLEMSSSFLGFRDSSINSSLTNSQALHNLPASAHPRRALKASLKDPYYAPDTWLTLVITLSWICANFTNGNLTHH